ncbi:MAG: hypothetical protein HYX42_15495 [Polaromonas sp.]|uniref:hypothetical protein n=1 Tax=Polaromonas sp. TaxID=1869339 RepID=UPI0025DC34C5|nr:hypothetical protein [Polaromonas sp.]MBI2727643.1 hypothetical protein [Polaromonas sp.]
MSVFNWFSRKSHTPAHSGPADSSGLRDSCGRSVPARDRPQAAPPVAKAGAADPANRSELRKVRRHARREQLYVAVREAMTRAGVLAASYRFKVLSLDQRGDQFLVMMDVAYSLGRQSDRLADIETLIVQTARARFEIVVTAVYWRSDARTAAEVAADRTAGRETMTSAPMPLAVAVSQAAAVSDRHAPLNMPLKKPASRYDPIQDDEVTAFKQALASASAAPVSVDASGKTRTGLHSYTLLTGFEDTEMPESAAVPALSATQYGDLN